MVGISFVRWVTIVSYFNQMSRVQAFYYNIRPSFTADGDINSKRFPIIRRFSTAKMLPGRFCPNRHTDQAPFAHPLWSGTVSRRTCLSTEWLTFPTSDVVGPMSLQWNSELPACVRVSAALSWRQQRRSVKRPNVVNSITPCRFAASTAGAPNVGALLWRHL